MPRNTVIRDPLSDRVDVAEVRKMLSIKPEELTENLETYEVEELRRKEEERLS